MILSRFWCCALPTLLVTACQAAAEIDLVLPPVPDLLPISAWVGAEGLAIRWVLRGPSAPLAPEDRIRAAGQVVRLGQLRTADLEVVGLQAVGAGAPVGLPEPAPIALRFRAAPQPVHVALVLDNSTAAAAVDAQQARITGAQALVDGILCAMAPCAPDGDVTLVVLQAGQAEVQISHGRDRRELDAALAALPQAASGTAPLWSGLDAALALARARAPTGSAAVVLYSVHGADASGTPTPPQLPQLLAGPPPTPLFAVQHDEHAEDLRRPVEVGGGALLALDAHRDLEGALAAARCALAGTWEVQLRTPLPDGAQRVQGELRLHVASEMRSAAFDLPLLLLRP